MNNFQYKYVCFNARVSLFYFMPWIWFSWSSSSYVWLLFEWTFRESVQWYFPKMLSCAYWWFNNDEEKVSFICICQARDYFNLEESNNFTNSFFFAFIVFISSLAVQSSRVSKGKLNSRWRILTVTCLLSFDEAFYHDSFASRGSKSSLVGWIVLIGRWNDVWASRNYLKVVLSCFGAHLPIWSRIIRLPTLQTHASVRVG